MCLEVHHSTKLELKPRNNDFCFGQNYRLLFLSIYLSLAMKSMSSWELVKVV